MREAAFGNVEKGEEEAGAGLKLVPANDGVEAEAALAFAIAGAAARAESLAKDLNTRFPLDTQMQSLRLPAIRAQLALDRKNPTEALDRWPSAGDLEAGSNPIHDQSFLPLSGVRTRRGILGGWARQRCYRRVSEDSRPQRHRLELLDGSVGASRSSSCQRLAIENLTGGGCRCCACPGACRLPGFPYALERRQPRHPHPEASESGVREARAEQHVVQEG